MAEEKLAKLRQGQEITPEFLENIRAAKINEIPTLYIDYINVGLNKLFDSFMRNRKYSIYWM